MIKKINQKTHEETRDHYRLKMYRNQAFIEILNINIVNTLRRYIIIYIDIPEINKCGCDNIV